MRIPRVPAKVAPVEALVETPVEPPVKALVEAPVEAFELFTFHMQGIETLIPLLEEWTQREFAQYPYLWNPPQGEVCPAHVLLCSENNGLVTVVKKGGDVVGLAAGVDFSSPTFQPYFGQSLIEKTRECGYDPSQMIYMCYFLTAPAYRNDPQIVEMIYNTYISFARRIGKTQFCYLEDPGREDHPLKPENPTPIEPWGHVIHGFKNMHMPIQLTWSTMQRNGTVVEEVHTVDFFVKDIQ